MTTLYLGNYATEVEWECLRDDGGLDGTLELAQPTGLLLMERTEAHVAALLEAAWDDNYHEEDYDEDKIPDGPDWTTDGWNGTTMSQTWHSKVLDCYVVLRAITPLEPVGGPT